MTPEIEIVLTYLGIGLTLFWVDEFFSTYPRTGLGVAMIVILAWPIAVVILAYIAIRDLFTGTAP